MREGINSRFPVIARLTSIRYDDLFDLPWSVWCDLALMVDTFVAANTQSALEAADV